MRSYAPILVLVLALIGCRDDGDSPDVFTPTPPEFTENEQIVIDNCELVNTALEAWRADNSGDLYPLDQYAQNTTGRNFISYLPEGQLLLNPYTGYATEPGDGPATQDGAIGYVAVSYDTGQLVGYQLEALGENLEMIYYLQVGHP